VSQVKKGVAAARNRALATARCELVAWLDADDRMTPNRLERQLRFFEEHTEAGVICSWARLINVKGVPIGVSRHAVDVERGQAEQNPSLFLEIVQSTVMARRSALLQAGGYREALRYAEDRDLWGRIVTGGGMILCQPEFLVDYRLHTGSITGRRAMRNDLTVRAIDLNVRRRLCGEPELSPAELTQAFAQRPAWARCNDARKFFARFHYNKATRYYGEGKLLLSAWMLSVASILVPVQTLQRVRAKLMRSVSRAV
jgi:glycosyltransferase involved in cell wall biosynthesis